MGRTIRLLSVAWGVLALLFFVDAWQTGQVQGWFVGGATAALAGGNVVFARRFEKRVK